MAAPYPRRGPMQGVARAVNRGSQGMAQGRFSGLSTTQPVMPPTPRQGIKVYEQDTEPLDAVVHDFWWDTSA